MSNGTGQVYVDIQSCLAFSLECILSGPIYEQKSTKESFAAPMLCVLLYLKKLLLALLTALEHPFT